MKSVFRSSELRTFLPYTRPWLLSPTREGREWEEESWGIKKEREGRGEGREKDSAFRQFSIMWGWWRELLFSILPPDRNIQKNTKVAGEWTRFPGLEKGLSQTLTTLDPCPEPHRPWAGEEGLCCSLDSISQVTQRPLNSAPCTTISGPELILNLLPSCSCFRGGGSSLKGKTSPTNSND